MTIWVFFSSIKRSHCPLWLIENVGGVTPHSGGRGCFIYTYLGQYVHSLTHTHPPTFSLNAHLRKEPQKLCLLCASPRPASPSCRMRGRFLRAPSTHLHSSRFICIAGRVGTRPISVQASLLKFYWKVCSGKLPHTQPTTQAPLPQRVQRTRARGDELVGIFHLASFKHLGEKCTFIYLIFIL